MRNVAHAMPDHNNVVPFTVPQLQPEERVFLLQLAESERATLIANDICAFGYGQHATHEQVIAARKLAALVLRSTKPEWVDAALKHAVNECDGELLDTDSRAIAEVLTVKVLQAYLGILDGSIVLPCETYLSITKDAVL